jgi:hypothetical protein
VVVSALAQVTDALVEEARLAGVGQADATRDAVRALRRRHEEMARLVRQPERCAELLAALEAEFDRLEAVATTLAVVGEVSPRSCDAILAVGELASSRIVAGALAEAGVPAAWVDGRGLLVTDAVHGSAAPDRQASDERLRSQLRPLLADGLVPVTGGFVGATAGGVTTTLGRGGSDYSAALFGAGLEAEEIQVWTDVDGMLTADPRIVAGARVVPRLSFDEASELAYFSQGPASQHDPASGRPGHPGPDPELHQPALGRHPDHGRRGRRVAGSGGDRLQAGVDAHRPRVDSDADGVRLPASRVRGVRAVWYGGGRGHDLGGERVGDDRRPPRRSTASWPSCGPSPASPGRPGWRS